MPFVTVFTELGLDLALNLSQFRQISVAGNDTDTP